MMGIRPPGKHWAYWRMKFATACTVGLVVRSRYGCSDAVLHTSRLPSFQARGRHGECRKINMLVAHDCLVVDGQLSEYCPRRVLL